MLTVHIGYSAGALFNCNFLAMQFTFTKSNRRDWNDRRFILINWKENGFYEFFKCIKFH